MLYKVRIIGFIEKVSVKALVGAFNQEKASVKTLPINCLQL